MTVFPTLTCVAGRVIEVNEHCQEVVPWRVKVATSLNESTAFLGKEQFSKHLPDLKKDDVLFAVQEWGYENDDFPDLEFPRAPLGYFFESYKGELSPELVDVCYCAKISTHNEQRGMPKSVEEIMSGESRFSINKAFVDNQDPLLEHLQSDGFMELLEGIHLLLEICSDAIRDSESIWKYMCSEGIHSIRKLEKEHIARVFGYHAYYVDLALMVLATERKLIYLPTEERYMAPEIAEKERARVITHVSIDFSELKSRISEKGLLLQTIECPSCGGSVNLPEKGNTTKCRNCSKIIYSVDIFEKFKDILRLG